MIDSVVFFYSKTVPESVQFLELIEDLREGGLNEIDTVSVDSPKIKHLLKHDNKYNIKVVPSLLILNNDSSFKVYTVRNGLREWFSELLSNVQEPEPETTLLTEEPTTTLEPTQMTMIQTNPSYTNPAPMESGGGPVVSKQIKKENEISAAEMAKQIAEQREAEEAEIENNRPFM